jgi:type IV pilus assembly protein PilE
MKKQIGFTLIELMIAVVILGILVSFAFMNYQRYVMKSNRAEAKTELLNVAARLQRCYTLYGRYNPDDGCDVYESLTGAAKITSEGRGFYEVDIAFVDEDEPSSDYTLTATAILAPQINDIDGPLDCTELTLTHTGAKTPAECW